jgi:hypothetical protein
LNSTFEFRLVLAPNYLLMTLIRISVTQVVTQTTIHDTENKNKQGGKEKKETLASQIHREH